MEKELRAGISQLRAKGESVETIFTVLYMTAGFPKHVNKEDFCAWADNPNLEEEIIVRYFIPEK